MLKKIDNPEQYKKFDVEEIEDNLFMCPFATPNNPDYD